MRKEIVDRFGRFILLEKQLQFTQVVEMRALVGLSQHPSNMAVPKCPSVNGPSYISKLLEHCDTPFLPTCSHYISDSEDLDPDLI